MKPYQLALFWLVFFGSYLIIVFFGYVLIPEGTLLEAVLKVKPDINSEEWDNFMGYVIFIGSAVVWGVTASLSKTWGEPH
jgi:hypothetical protein